MQRATPSMATTWVTHFEGVRKKKKKETPSHEREVCDRLLIVTPFEKTRARVGGKQNRINL